MSQSNVAQVSQGPSLEALRDGLPGYAKDIKLNLSSVLTPEGAPELTPVQLWGTAVASAYATRSPELIRTVEGEATGLLSAAELEAARTAATLMAMNNIYYRFTHLVHDEELGKMPARLRMTGLASHGINKADFELFSLAVSAINGCGKCMEAHVHEVEKGGVSKLGIQSSIRIAAVINAAAQALVRI